MNEAFQSAWDLNEGRLRQYPDSPFFLFAKRELVRISDCLKTEVIDRDFYDSLNIGVMCARELEAVDMEYCDHVYALLEDLWLRT